MEFHFRCSTRYLTSERSEHVRYRAEHEKTNSDLQLHKQLNKKKTSTLFLVFIN